MTITDWPTLLDVIEQGLDRTPPKFLDYLPAVSGPVPRDLADRAQNTLRRMGEIEAALEAQRAEIGRELAGLASTRAAAGAPVPRFLDTRA